MFLHGVVFSRLTTTRVAPTSMVSASAHTCNFTFATHTHTKCETFTFSPSYSLQFFFLKKSLQVLLHQENDSTDSSITGFCCRFDRSFVIYLCYCRLLLFRPCASSIFRLYALLYLLASTKYIYNMQPAFENNVAILAAKLKIQQETAVVCGFASRPTVVLSIYTITIYITYRA